MTFLYSISWISYNNSKVGALISIFQMRKLRLRQLDNRKQNWVYITP